MTFSVGFLEVIKFIVPGGAWLAIGLLGPWGVPSEITDQIENNQILAAVGLLLVSYVIGSVSTPISFSLLTFTSQWRFALWRPKGRVVPRLRRTRLPGWPFDTIPGGTAALLKRVDPTRSDSMITFYDQFRRRDPHRAMYGEGTMTFFKIALEAYAPGLAAESRYRESEINLPGGLFLPAVVMAAIGAGVWGHDLATDSFNYWAAIAFSAGVIYTIFARFVFHTLRLEEVRFIYRAFFICAPRDSAGRYRPGESSDATEGHELT